MDSNGQVSPSRFKVVRSPQLESRPRALLFGPISIVLMLMCFLSEFSFNNIHLLRSTGSSMAFAPTTAAYASLIIGDSAIEIQEVNAGNERPSHSSHEHPSLILGSTSDLVNGNLLEPQWKLKNSQYYKRPNGFNQMLVPPLKPISDSEESVASKNVGSRDDITDGDRKSRDSHDYDIDELDSNGRKLEKAALDRVLSREPEEASRNKMIAGKVVDFELTPAGGHNKAKIKKKKSKKAEGGEMYQKWAKKKNSEKMEMEKEHKESMKKKKEQGKKGKKKWGLEEHGQKKKGKFKKRKWGKKVKKGKGVKKGKKGKKFLKDKGHKNTGFKTIYHKEEWGKSSKWHDIKREKKWDEKSKKWKKKWKKEKGKKYKGENLKKFERKKKSGKKYEKENKGKFKKYKKDGFKKVKKADIHEHSKKKAGGAKELKKKS